MLAGAAPSPPDCPCAHPPAHCASGQGGALLWGHQPPGRLIHSFTHWLTGEAIGGLSPRRTSPHPPALRAIPGAGTSTASTWPPRSPSLAGLAPPRAGGQRCWNGRVLLQSWPLSGVTSFCSWCGSCEAGEGYSSPAQPLAGAAVGPSPEASNCLPATLVVPLSHWLVPQWAPPPSPLVHKRSPKSVRG